jgi:DNA polymerase-3 subunit gamma/tau
MSHEALYRKYRPRTFSELMGQDAINRTLTNALGTRQVAHAYLFCGPRGTGKTSTARLLAKTLNCEAAGTEPCNRCPSCQEITSGSSMDVIEIDAASNRGIDDMRSLREQVRFASMNGRYKVYIIDECHMLTTEAVNALLKTLEEPPDNVVFVMATTEAHKVLPTIVSRCQRFDFQRIPTPVLLARLQQVATAEQIPVSAESLRAIARRAAGGLRDALTLLDQVASLSIDGMAVSDDLVFQVLGEVRSESLLAMGEAMLHGDVVGLWEQASAYLKAGYDPQTLLRELMQHLRNLLIVQVAADRAIDLDVPESLVGPLSAQAAQWTQADLIYCLELLNETAERVRRATHDQIWLEAGLARVCQRQAIASILDLQARVEALENRAGIAPGDRPAASRPTPPARPAPRPVAAPAPTAPPPAPPAPVQPAPAMPAASMMPPPSPVSAPEPVMPPPPAPEAAAEPVQPEPAVVEPPRDLVMPPPVAAEPSRAAVMPPPVAESVMPPQPEPVAAPVAEVSAPAAAAPSAPVAAAPAAPMAPTGNLPAPPSALWPKLVDAIAERHGPTGGILRSAHLVGVDLGAGTLTIGFKEEILKDQTEKTPKRVALIEGGIKAIFGTPLRLKCVVQAAPPPAPEPEPWMDEPGPPDAYAPQSFDMAPEPVAPPPVAAAPIAPPPESAPQSAPAVSPPWEAPEPVTPSVVPPAVAAEPVAMPAPAAAPEPEDPFLAATPKPRPAPPEADDPFLAATPVPRTATKPPVSPKAPPGEENVDLVAEAARIFKGKVLATP